LCGAGRGDYRECAVISGDGDARDGDGLSGREAVCRAGSDGDEKTVFGCAGGAGGDGDRGGLRRSGGTGGHRDDHVFVDYRGCAAGAGLADAIEIAVVILAWEVVAGAAVADGQIFPAENGGGGAVGILRQSGGDAGERAGGGFLVEHAARVEGHGAQGGVARFVGFYVVDGGIAREGAEQCLQTGTRFHAAVAEDHVLAIGRDPVREFGGRQIGNQPAENFDGCVE